MREPILSTLRQRADDIDRQLSTLRRALVGHNTVLQSDPGLYLRRVAGAFVPVHITLCARYEPEVAEFLSRDITSPDGRHPMPVNLKTALELELRATHDLINQLEPTI